MVKVFYIFSYLLSVFVLCFINSGEQSWHFWENCPIRPQCGLFFFSEDSEDMLSVGAHYSRLHNIKSTSGLIKNSFHVGITSEKFCVHKNNLWSIIPFPSWSKINVHLHFGLWCFDVVPSSGYFIFILYPRLASLKNASEHINVAVRWTEWF